MQRSFKARLEALEQLEAEREREQQTADEAGIPDVRAMDDAEVFDWMLYGVRLWHLRPGMGEHAPPIRLVAHSLLDARRLAFWHAIIDRAQPMIDAGPPVFIPLYAHEAEQMIGCIDAGLMEVKSDFMPPRPGMRGSYYHIRLCVPPASGMRDAPPEHRIACAVNTAREWDIYQRHYPNQVGAFEFTTPAEYRDWLVSLLEKDDEAVHQTH